MPPVPSAGQERDYREDGFVGGRLPAGAVELPRRAIEEDPGIATGGRGHFTRRACVSEARKAS